MSVDKLILEWIIVFILAFVDLLCFIDYARHVRIYKIFMFVDNRVYNADSSSFMLTVDWLLFVVFLWESSSMNIELWIVCG